MNAQKVKHIGGALLVGASLGALLTLAALRWVPLGGNQSGHPTVASPQVGEPSSGQGLAGIAASEGCLSAADIYQRVRPAVVEIRGSGGSGGFPAQAESEGSGVVIDRNGLILTNYHVVSGAARLEVRLADDTSLAAQVVGTDPGDDLALVRVDPAGHDLVTATLGDSDSVRVGDPVLAIGNPFGLVATLTQGIVSGTDRTFSSGQGTRPIRGMIQTDAPVNPGNSGGPLLDCRGNVIGIVTALENPTGQNVNVGVAFAVAINTAKRYLPDMQSGKTVSHPWLGIAGEDVTPSLAQELGLSVQSGVYVVTVAQGSPAQRAGLRGAFASEREAQRASSLLPGGDVITAIDGHPVTTVEELAGYIDSHYRAGDSVRLDIARDGQKISVTVALAEWPR